VPRGRSIDLWTSYVEGAHGPARQKQIDAELLVRRKVASPDLLTAFVTGFKGAPIATQPQWNYNPSSDLPPRLARPSAELTWVTPGRQGAPAQTQNDDTPLPPRGRGASIDLGTWAGPGFIAQGSIASGPIEASLPPLGRGPSPDLRTAVQSGFVSQGAVQQKQNDTALPPLGRGQAIDVRTWFQLGAHGAVAQAQNDDALPLVRARGSPDLLTWTVAAQVPAALVQPPAYDTSLPPLGRGASIDLRTSYQSGAQGARAQTQNDDALPSFGRGPPFDIRTWIVPGRAGAVAQTQNDDALPPRGRGSAIEPTWVVGGLSVVQVAQVPAYDTSLPIRARASVDLITWLQPGSHGAPAQIQNDDSLPPRGRGPAVDLTWNIAGQVTVALVQPIPAYDTSLPPSRRDLLIDLGTSYQAGSQGAKAQTQNDDARPPLGRGSSIDILTWLISGSHGAAAQTQNDDALPPRGRGPAVELTWTVSGTVVAQLAPVPAYDTSLPPSLRRPSIDLGTSYQAGFVLQGARAQTQNETDLPPRGRGPAVDLSWNISGQFTAYNAPFYQTDTSLPPLGRGQSVDLRTSFQFGFVSYGATAQTQNDDSLPPRGRGPAIELTWSESLNPGGPFTPPAPPAQLGFDLGVRHRYTVSQWTQVQEWLKARRAKRKEEEAKAAAAANIAKLAVAAIDEVEAPAPVKVRRPLPLSTKARRKLREALVKPLPPPPIVALAVTTLDVVEVKVPGPSFAERRAQLRAEWEAVLAAHEDAIEQEDEEAVVHLFMHMIGEDRLDG
jgi:hypothetical protein